MNKHGTHFRSDNQQSGPLQNTKISNHTNIIANSRGGQTYERPKVVNTKKRDNKDF